MTTMTDLLPAGFGDGWLTRNARDMIRIGIWAGFDRDDLLKRVAMAGDPERMTNAATVERVLGEMDAEIPR